jgi:hypoxanthine phosphoribosyltransferase
VKRAAAPLFSEEQIRAGVEEMAAGIASASRRPDIAAWILVGAFVFAADLLRALSRHGLDLPVEPIWLRSYGEARQRSETVAVLVPPGEAVRGRHVLLLDGVLDHGRTLVRARDLLFASGAANVTTAVIVDKRRNNALLRADFAAFTDVDRFIVGYGMDDAGEGRALPYIAAVD